MTDHELLELVAKAAKYEIEPWDGHGLLLTHESRGYWNPLTDDGDALRLAVTVLNWPYIERAFEQQVTAMFAVGNLPEDPYAATRRAITRAAAEIGRNMT